MPEKTQDDIRIKNPTAPASVAQMGLIDALAEAGVVSPEELSALGDSPTKQEASDLISAHSEEVAFKAVQDARAAEREAAKGQGISLKDMEETSRDAADALAGHDAQDDRLPETR